jgi:peptidylprolyl isomerase domain and WD repeat-containing protein 1
MDPPPAPTSHEPAAKRPRQEEEPPAAAAAQRKPARAEFESLHLEALPCAAMYERSYLHRDQVTHLAAARETAFVISASRDGHVKFWKKEAEVQLSLVWALT